MVHNLGLCLILFSCMVLIEKPPGLGFSTTEAIIALDFQPHPINEGWKGIERLAAAAGSLIKIWSFSLLPFSRLISLNGTCEIGTDDIAMGSNQCSVDQTIDADCPTNVSRCHTRSQCVALLRDHAPAYLVGLRFSPTGKF